MDPALRGHATGDVEQTISQIQYKRLHSLKASSESLQACFSILSDIYKKQKLINMLYTYDQFLAEKEVINAQRGLLANILKQFDEIKPVMEDAMVLVESGVFDMYLTNINEENLIQKAKAKFDAAVQIAKEKGKQALSDAQEKIIKLGGNIVNVIKMIVEKLKEWVNEEWTKAQAFYMNAAKSKEEELKKAVKGKSEESKNALISEVGNMKKMAKGVAIWVSTGFVKDAAAAAFAVAKEDDGEGSAKEAVVFDLMMIQAINEAVVSGEINFVELLEEGEGGLPFVSSIAHKMHKVPPFNLLDKVKKAASKITGGVLNSVSYMATELAGAPGPYKFVAMAALTGIVSEVVFKHVAQHALVHAIPAVGTVASIVATIAMGLAIVAVIETILQKEGEDKEKH